MGAAFGCSRRHRESPKQQQGLLLYQQRLLYERMQLRQVREAEEVSRKFDLANRGWPHMTKQETAEIVAMHDGHLAEEKEFMGQFVV